MITMLLVAIIMLNALIAIMGDTYDRVSERRLEWGLQGKALVLIEIEYTMTKDWNNQALFPRWLHVIKRAEDSEEGGTEWSGRLRATVNGVATAVKEGLRHKLDGIETKVDMRVGAIETTLDTRVGAIETTLDTRFGAIETTLDTRVGAIETTLDTRVGAIEAQLDTIIAQLLLAVPASAQSKPSLAEANPTRSDGPIPPPMAKLQSWAASIGAKPTLAEANPTQSDGPISPPMAKLQSWAASIVGQNKK